MKPIAILLLCTLAACSKADNNNNTVVADSAVQPILPPPPAPTIALDSGATKLFPVDQADPSFRAFRTQLLEALARRDTTFLLSILSPEIKNSFGGDDSIAGFRRMWHLDKPNSPVWETLGRVLRLGGKMQDSTFVAPYVFAFWPDSIDAFEHIAVIHNAAPLFDVPDTTAKVLGTASYSILKVLASDKEGFANVALPNGTKVWMKSLDVYSPVYWRAYFVKRNARWTMLTFVAGD